MNYLAKSVLAGILLTGVTSLYAQDEDATDETGWSGDGEFGLVSTTGNTESTSLNLRLNIFKQTENWRHRFSASALNASQDSVSNTKRYGLEVQSDRKLNEKSFLFGAFRWDSDKFGAYDPQTSITAGYGRELMSSETHVLTGEIGAGYRKFEERTTGITSSNAIARILLDDLWQIFSSTSWSNRLLIETGSDNTFTQFNTGVAVAMNERFALKVGFEIRHNSDIPLGVLEKTDTTTTMNLVYNF